MTTYAEILSAAMALPPHERSELAETLLDSAAADAASNGSSHISAEWKEEIARRSAAYLRGEMKGIPWQQVRDEVRRKHQGNA
jgi:putative addiction module component (TIGR02574 family)